AWRIMTGPTSTVCKLLAVYREKLPCVMVGPQGELQDAEGAGTAYLAVGLGRSERVVIPTASAYDKLADSVCLVSLGARRLRRKAFISMVMTHQHNLCAIVIQSLEERTRRRL